MRNVIRMVSVVVFACALVAAPGLRADEKGDKKGNNEEKDSKEVKVDLKDLPQAVVDAVKKAQPGGTLVEADKEDKNGTTVYEVDVKNNGKTWEVKVDASGKVLSNKEDDEEDEKK